MNGIDNMMDDYNKNFIHKDVDAEYPKPGEQGFDESTMLMEKYPVAMDESLIIAAPKADSYKWEVYKIVREKQYVNGYLVENVEKIPMAIPNTTGQTFGFYVKDIEDMTVDTYELRLEVKANNMSFRDAAMIIVYEAFYAYN